MKKILSLLLSILLCTLMFSSCTSKTDSDQTTNPVESTTEEPTTEKQIDSNTKRQLILLSNSINDWLKPRYKQVALAVTDLNQNGLLEIVVTSYEADEVEEMTSFTEIYEISSSYDGLNIMSKTKINGQNIEPDYVLFDGTCYYDAILDDYRFINYDVILDGKNRQIDVYSINFGKGQAEASLIGSTIESLSDESKTIYKDPDGKEKTEDEYTQLFTDFFEDCVEYYANIGWTVYTLNELDVLVNSNQDVIYKALEDSYKMFSMEK